MRISYDKNDFGKSFALAVAVMLIASVVWGSVFALFTDAETGQMPDWAYWTMQALYSVTVGCTALLYAFVTKTQLPSATGLNKKPPLTHILWGCLSAVFLIALMLPVNEWLLDAIEQAGLTRPSVDLPLQFFPLLLVGTLIPSFTEEIVFRGTVAQSLAGQRTLPAVLASGALFSLFHLNAAQTLHQFVLGAFLALLMLRSGSVWTCVAVHFFNNFVAVVLSFVPIEEQLFTAMSPWLAAVGAVGFALCVFGYLKTTSDCRKGTAADDVNDLPMQRNSVFYLFVSVFVCIGLWIMNLLAL